MGVGGIYFIFKTASVFKLPAVNVCVRGWVCVWGVEGGRWGVEVRRKKKSKQIY